MLVKGVETSGTCVVHLSLFVLFQGVEMSGTCAGTPKSVCVVSGS